MHTCAKEKIIMWQSTVQENYSSVEELEYYNDMYGVCARCGFQSAMDMWNANPMIKGGTHPADFGLADNTSILDDLAMEIQLVTHLQYNHFPALPLTLIPFCKAAIKFCVENDMGHEIEEIEIEGKSPVTAGDVCDHFNLWSLVSSSM
jgi:hypothetical protein